MTDTTTTPATALQRALSDYVAAGFAGLYVTTYEPEEAICELTREARIAVWDISQGLRLGSETVPDTTDPLAVLGAFPALSDGQNPTVLLLVNFHRFLQSAEIIQALANALHDGKSAHRHIVILAPLVQLPPELEKLFTVVDHPLPDRAELADIAGAVATEPGELPDEAPALDHVIDAAAGLTRLEAENAYALSLVQHSRLDPSTLWTLKAQTIRKGGLLTMHRGGQAFDALGGLEGVKEFCLRSLRPDRPRDINPRGILLLGPPGTGKSTIAKALGNETGRPTVCLSVGNLLGSLVGQSEERTRQALAQVDAMAPCILFVDEIEKGLAGSTGGALDSGVSSRLLGTLLTWLQDHETDVFVVGTCNDARSLPAAFSRAGRFDGVFFVDLPGEDQREMIWGIYRQRYHIGGTDPQPEDRDWTGAEIEACCRLARMQGVLTTQAARNIIPVATTAAESIEELRRWASGRCLDADSPGIYQRNPAAQPRRTIDRGPSGAPSNN